MTPEDLFIGATVGLISGGPMMTVESFDSHGTVDCVWFTEPGETRRDDFHIDTLVLLCTACESKAHTTTEKPS